MIEEKIFKSAFARYYKRVRVPPPPEIHRREFGVGEFGKKIVRRHLSFSSPRELWNYLETETPLYISYSVGYFEYPANTPMEAKKLLGADMVFEFDVDELGLPSEKDVWICPSCGAKGFGSRRMCPMCGEPTKLIIFPDETRMERVKDETETLVNDFLISDLGFSRNEIAVNFSGDRGFHIHLRSEAVYDLPKDARIELVEYITGQALDPAMFFEPAGDFLRGPRPDMPGWFGRIARIVLAFLQNPEHEDARIARILKENAPQYAEYIRKGLWPVIGSHEESKELWCGIARKLSPYMGKVIDVNTSVDIHRLIRLPESLHGTTGFAAKIVKNLRGFNPYKDAVVLPEKPYLTLHVSIAPEFELKGRTFGPFEDEIVELPLYVSIFLIGKGVAEWSSPSKS